MIAMTMLPDMVVCLCGVVWEWLEVVEVGTRVESAVMCLWWFMRVLCFSFSCVELESLKLLGEVWQRPSSSSSSSIEGSVDEMKCG
jgi:hypothetical protein